MTASGPRWTGKVRLVEEHLEDPMRWTKPSMVFVNSMSDLFHEDVDDVMIEKIILVMMQSPKHTFQVLTKRAKRMQEFLSSFHTPKQGGWPLPNVWWGVSVEDQAAADLRIPLLLKTPAAVRWISAEPLLGDLDLCAYLPHYKEPGRCKHGMLDWVVVGCESGPGARPMDLAWVRDIRDDVDGFAKFFVKQITGPSGKLADMADFPADLRIRQYPTGVPAGDSKQETKKDERKIRKVR
jgi:protein gp37